MNERDAYETDREEFAVITGTLTRQRSDKRNSWPSTGSQAGAKVFSGGV